MPSRITTGGRQSWRGYDLLSVLTKLGQRDNLKLCLDAGDAASYTSGQSWLDRSGNGYDFFLGADGSATATDPTFNGTAGLLTSGEYFSFDGGDKFTYDTTNETWMQNIHKDGAKFTLAAWVNIPSTGVACAIAATANSGTGIGFELRGTTSRAVQLIIGNGAGAALSIAGSNGDIGDAVWSFVAASVDEAVGSNGAFTYANGVATLATSTYASPSASNADGTFTIGSEPDGGVPVPNLSRIGMFAAWEGRALSAGELNAIYMATRDRFGV